MTDRIASFTVILEREMRDDDAEVIAQAIGRLRGVLEVRPGEVVSTDHVIAKAQARGEILARIQKAMDDYV